MTGTSIPPLVSFSFSNLLVVSCDANSFNFWFFVWRKGWISRIDSFARHTVCLLFQNLILALHTHWHGLWLRNWRFFFRRSLALWIVYIFNRADISAAWLVILASVTRLFHFHNVLLCKICDEMLLWSLFFSGMLLIACIAFSLLCILVGLQNP